MKPLIKQLLKPLPMEQRVVGRIIRPLYHSKVLDSFFGGRIHIEREVRTKGTVACSWVTMPVLKALSGTKLDSSRGFVSAIPRNDPLRPMPKNAFQCSVWALMAYLCDLGPVEADIVATAAFPLEKKLHIAYWGLMEEYAHLGRRLYLIRENTPDPRIHRTVNQALLLVVQPGL